MTPFKNAGRSSAAASNHDRAARLATGALLALSVAYALGALAFSAGWAPALPLLVTRL